MYGDQVVAPDHIKLLPITHNISVRMPHLVEDKSRLVLIHAHNIIVVDRKLITAHPVEIIDRLRGVVCYPHPADGKEIKGNGSGFYFHWLSFKYINIIIISIPPMVSMKGMYISIIK